MGSNVSEAVTAVLRQHINNTAVMDSTIPVIKWMAQSGTQARLSGQEPFHPTRDRVSVTRWSILPALFGRR